MREPRQVLVGRGDQADICAQGLAAAEALELPVLDDAQDLLLHEGGGGREFVEEERAAVGALEAALVRPGGPGEGARLVAEEFALEERVGDGRAVHLEERGVPAVREIVQPRRDQLLARAALADDEHGLLERRDRGDLVECGEERRGLADQPILFANHAPILANCWRNPPCSTALRGTRNGEAVSNQCIAAQAGVGTESDPSLGQADGRSGRDSPWRQTMSVFSRLSDIVNSNLNAMLDRAEDPEKMVRLIIQEMEETLVEVRTTSARAIADRKELSRRRESLEAEAAEWERKAELAVRKERDDLARAALAERNKAAEMAEAAGDEVRILEETLAKLNGDVAALQAKIKDAKARQNAPHRARADGQDAARHPPPALRAQHRRRPAPVRALRAQARRPRGDGRVL